MGTLTLSLGVRHNLEPVRQEVDRYPDMLTRAMREATEDATDLLADAVEQYIVSKAGGMYWDLDASVTHEPQGARGRVVTPPSKPHRIEAPPGKALGPMEVGGEERFFKAVNHPGSRPLDWTPGAEAGRSRLERKFTDAVGEVFR